MVWHLVPALPPALFTVHLQSYHSEFLTIPRKVKPFSRMLSLLTVSFPQIHLADCSLFSSLTLTAVYLFYIALSFTDNELLFMFDFRIISLSERLIFINTG